MYDRCTLGAGKDIDINRCDYLVEARGNIKIHLFLITIIGSFLAVYPFMADMDEEDWRQRRFDREDAAIAMMLR